jgi:hypothetical protein
LAVQGDAFYGALLRALTWLLITVIVLSFAYFIAVVVLEVSQQIAANQAKQEAASRATASAHGGAWATGGHRSRDAASRGDDGASQSKLALAAARSARSGGSTAVLEDGSAITATSAVKLLTSGRGATSAAAMETLVNPLHVEQQQKQQQQQQVRERGLEGCWVW